MNLETSFQQYINEHDLFQQKDKLLLAVSGGVDSVVLCELCKLAGYDFIIAHCNFQLRGAESDRDEGFVKELGKKYGVEVLVKKFDTEKYAAENKLSIQVAARELRYKWFNVLAGSQNSANPPEPRNADKQPVTVNWILTAHHANDNIETLLMNFFKGTGINGLHGILPKQADIIRPLLFAKKEALTGFAIKHNLAFVEDSSNASEKYTRNYFRNRLIPDLKEVYPQVEDNLLNNIERFREIEILYRQSVQLTRKKLLEPRAGEVHIPVLKLLKTVPLRTMIHEIIKDYHFTAHQADDVMALLSSESGKYVRSATHRIIKNRKWLIISPVENKKAHNILIEENDKQLEFELGKLTIEQKQVKSTPQKPGDILQDQVHIAQLNADEIRFPLLLRSWKKGDYFYPLGMQNPPAGRAGKKKLSRFFTDQKLSLTQKERVWVIESDKKIIWVVGMRIDDRFKITPGTKNIIRIKLTGTE